MVKRYKPRVGACHSPSLYADCVDEMRVLREFIAGERPWDRVMAFGLVASRLEGVEERVTREAIDGMRERASGSTARDVVTSLFAPTAKGEPVLRGDGESYDDPANSFIHEVVLRRKGIPLTLAVIASEVASGRGVPLDVVGMPGHVLVRDGLSTSSYFDVFGGGTELDEAGCRELYQRTTGLTDWKPEFLAPITTAQQVFRLLNNLKSIYRRRADLSRLRGVMAMRALFPGVEAMERGEFARLMRETN